MSFETCELTRSEINHLRRLLGYIQTEVGQSPEEMEATLKSIAEKLGPDAFNDERINALKISYERAKSVPNYIRAAIKALEKTIKRHDGDILDVESSREVPRLEEN